MPDHRAETIFTHYMPKNGLIFRISEKLLELTCMKLHTKGNFIENWAKIFAQI